MFGNKHTDNGNFGLGLFAGRIRFVIMDCDVPFRKEKLNEFKVLPYPEQAHWVLCSGKRCLAILNDHRKWLCFATGKELTDVVTVRCD